MEGVWGAGKQSECCVGNAVMVALAHASLCTAPSAICAVATPLQPIPVVLAPVHKATSNCS